MTDDTSWHLGAPGQPGQREGHEPPAWQPPWFPPGKGEYPGAPAGYPGAPAGYPGAPAGSGGEGQWQGGWHTVGPAIPGGYGHLPGGQQPGHEGWYTPAAPKPGVIPLRPLAVGELLDGSFTSVRHNPKATLGLAAVLLTISQVFSAAISWQLSSALRSLPSTLTSPTPGESMPPQEAMGYLAHFTGIAVPLVLLILLVNLVTGLVLTGLLTAVIGRGVLGHKIPAREAWRLARPRLLALLGAVLLTVGAYLAPWALLAFLAFVLLVAGVPVVAVVVLAIAGSLATICVMAWFWVMFKMAAPAVILERLGPVQAMSRSWRLVHGSFWRVFGISLLASLIVAVAGWVLQFPFLVAAQVVGISGAGGVFGGPGAVAVTSGTSIAVTLISALGVVIAGSVTRPIEAGVTVLLYVDLRMRREGLDLALQHAAAGPAGDEFALWRPPGSHPGTVPSAAQDSPRAW